MKKKLLLFALACITGFLLHSCDSSRKTVACKPSKQPKFIDNVYIAPHNKSNVTANAVAPKNAERLKPNPIVAAAVEKNSMETARVYSASCKMPRHHDDEDDRSVRKKYADILGVRTKDLGDASLYEFIDRWYGTNYRLGGCDVSGIDCSGFVQKLYSEVYGVDLVRTAVEQFSNCKRIKRYKDAEEGDLVFFHVHGRRISHVGIYLANDYFVHASASQGVIISNLNEEYWHRYFAGAGRIPHGE